MPIYEYECLSCGKNFEYFQSISEKPIKKCESCGGKVQKVISQSSFQLKGSGWYKTDYTDSGKKNKDSKESKNTPKSTD